MTDVISRLMSKIAAKRVRTASEKSILNEVFTFFVTLVEMIENFKSRLVTVYNRDKQWA